MMHWDRQWGGPPPTPRGKDQVGRRPQEGLDRSDDWSGKRVHPTPDQGRYAAHFPPYPDQSPRIGLIADFPREGAPIP